ncbi:MAG: TetR/AcrR family transcriptional regulator [Pseudolabrys sp.]|nr:TetR/AcrR family transcriptional regulator [Pseudolabrys sp.]
MSSSKSKPAVSPRAAVLPQLGEVFRAHGYEGASLSLITAATGLGKGSLYHLFPGGKAQMAKEVLAEIDQWFEREVFAPLRDGDDAAGGIARMFKATDAYFRSGRRVCLVGVFALGAARDEFADAVHGYFERWRAALASALRRAGHARGEAAELAEDVLAGIQGALVLARAADDPKVFSRALKRLSRRVAAK